MASERTPLGLYVATCVFLIVIMSVVGASFPRHPPLSFLPTPLQPHPAGDGFVVDNVTIDARDA